MRTSGPPTTTTSSNVNWGEGNDGPFESADPSMRSATGVSCMDFSLDSKTWRKMTGVPVRTNGQNPGWIIHSMNFLCPKHYASLHSNLATENKTSLESRLLRCSQLEQGVNSRAVETAWNCLTQTGNMHVKLHEVGVIKHVGGSHGVISPVNGEPGLPAVATTQVHATCEL